MSAQQVIDEARPMLEDLLPKIGIVPDNSPVVTADCLVPFSEWVSDQEVDPEDLAFFCSFVGAFIIVYLCEHHAAKTVIKDQRIYMAMPAPEGISIEFEPYAVAQSIAAGKGGSLIDFLNNVSDEHALA